MYFSIILIIINLILSIKRSKFSLLRQYHYCLSIHGSSSFHVHFYHFLSVTFLCLSWGYSVHHKLSTLHLNLNQLQLYSPPIIIYEVVQRSLSRSVRYAPIYHLPSHWRDAHRKFFPWSLNSYFEIEVLVRRFLLCTVMQQRVKGIDYSKIHYFNLQFKNLVATMIWNAKRIF